MPSKGPVYLSEDEIVKLHDRVIGLIGGMPGIRDEAALATCVAQPKTAVFGHERFASLYDKAAAYCCFLVRTRPFFDGNKRTGLLAAMHFLLSNGVEPLFDEDEMYEVITSMATGELGVETLAEIFRKADKAQSGRPDSLQT